MTLSGEQGAIWRKQTIVLDDVDDGPEPFQLLIEAVIADESGYGDIAVDDVVFHDGCV